jgi:hypothetical protein
MGQSWLSRPQWNAIASRRADCYLAHPRGSSYWLTIYHAALYVAMAGAHLHYRLAGIQRHTTAAALDIVVG